MTINPFHLTTTIRGSRGSSGRLRPQTTVGGGRFMLSENRSRSRISARTSAVLRGRWAPSGVTLEEARERAGVIVGEADGIQG